MSTKFCKVKVEENTASEPCSVADAIEAFLQNDPDIGQDVVDNLRAAATTLRSFQGEDFLLDAKSSKSKLKLKAKGARMQST
ncbi:hypothetical protein WJX75_002886 [Coccomyxa subellipsoidea]|uniref:Uncharacterized protein n=1 Tax=Coccomyxa subellipsoidea TaxID=248742 RepID=A0ABR2YX49_9CHLO